MVTREQQQHLLLNSCKDDKAKQSNNNSIVKRPIYEKDNNIRPTRIQACAVVGGKDHKFTGPPRCLVLWLS